VEHLRRLWEHVEARVGALMFTSLPKRDDSGERRLREMMDDLKVIGGAPVWLA
jgi:hypothetical protein